MRTVTTESGFSAVIDEEAFDNMELFDALAEVESGNPLGLSKAADLLLDQEDKKRLYDHVRENGRVPLVSLAKEITALVRGFGSAGKN